MAACVPYSAWLFIDVLWYYGSAMLVMSDVIFDVLTCIRYYNQGWYVSFILAIIFIFLPAALVGIADFCEIDFIAVGDEEAEASIEKRKRKKGAPKRGGEEEAESRSGDLDEDRGSRIDAETMAHQFRPSNEKEENDALLKTPTLTPSHGYGRGRSSPQRARACTVRSVSQVSVYSVHIESEVKTDESDCHQIETVGRNDHDLRGENSDDLRNNPRESVGGANVCDKESNENSELILANGDNLAAGEESDADEADGKGTCRAPSYVYYRSGQLSGSKDDVKTLRTVESLVQIRVETVSNHSNEGERDEGAACVEKAPNGQIQDETAEDESGATRGLKARCESVLCNNILHLFLNAFVMQCAVFGRRFVLAHNFGRRWYRYVTSDKDEREFQRRHERLVNAGKVAYDLAENEVQEKYLDLKYEDEALFRLWMMESLTESLPQLLINLYVIVKYHNNSYVQYISAILSFLTLAWGVTSPERYFREIQIVFHGRDYKTRAEAVQIFFIFVYKGLLLAARSLTLVYFTIAFHYYVILVLGLHWLLVFGRSLYYKLYRGILKDVRYVRLVTNSIFCIFLYFHVSNKKRVQGAMLQYYVVYVVENITMILLWYFLSETVSHYDTPVLIVVIGSTLLGILIMLIYYTFVHKSRAYIVNSYRVLECFCLPFVPRHSKGVIVCKNLPTWINCYVTNSESLIPVKQDHVYVDQRVRPAEGHRFYFGRDTVFCARPQDVHLSPPEESRDPNDEVLGKEWMQFYDAGEMRYARKSDCMYDFIDNRGREVHVAFDNFKWYPPQKRGGSNVYCSL